MYSSEKIRSLYSPCKGRFRNGKVTEHIARSGASTIRSLYRRLRRHDTYSIYGTYSTFGLLIACKGRFCTAIWKNILNKTTDIDFTQQLCYYHFQRETEPLKALFHMLFENRMVFEANTTSVNNYRPMKKILIIAAVLSCIVASLTMQRSSRTVSAAQAEAPVAMSQEALSESPRGDSDVALAAASVEPVAEVASIATNNAVEAVLNPVIK
jgi:hypothetical protein